MARRRFADHLLQTRLKSRNNGLRVVYSITINRCRTTSTNVHKYLGMVRQASRHGVDESLILAIMQTESSLTLMRSAVPTPWG